MALEWTPVTMTPDQVTQLLTLVGRIADALEATVPKTKKPAIKVSPKESWEPTSLMRKFNLMMGRRDTTPWDEHEVKRLNIIKEIMEPEDIDTLVEFYTYKLRPGEVDDRYLRVTLITLLNNTMGEADKAKRWLATRSQQTNKPTEARLRVL